MHITDDPTRNVKESVQTGETGIVALPSGIVSRVAGVFIFS